MLGLEGNRRVAAVEGVAGEELNRMYSRFDDRIPQDATTGNKLVSRGSCVQRYTPQLHFQEILERSALLYEGLPESSFNASRFQSVVVNSLGSRWS